MKKTNLLVAITIALSANAAFAGGTVAPAPAEAPAVPAPAPAPAPAPVVVAPAPAPVVVVPGFIPSWYVGVGIGQSKVRDLDTSAFEGSGVTINVDDKDTSYKIFGGYRFHPNFAVELGYTDLGKATVDATVTPGFDSVNPARGHAEVKAQAVTLDAVGILPFANNFEVFGKLGVYEAHVKGSSFAVNTGSDFSASTTNNNSGFHYGIGLGYNFTRNWAVKAEWERFNNVGGGSIGKSDVDNASVSVAYKF